MTWWGDSSEHMLQSCTTILGSREPGMSSRIFVVVHITEGQLEVDQGLSDLQTKQTIEPSPSWSPAASPDATTSLVPHFSGFLSKASLQMEIRAFLSLWTTSQRWATLCPLCSSTVSFAFVCSCVCGLKQRVLVCLSVLVGVLQPLESHCQFVNWVPTAWLREWTKQSRWPSSVWTLWAYPLGPSNQGQPVPQEPTGTCCSPPPHLIYRGLTYTVASSTLAKGSQYLVD